MIELCKNMQKAIIMRFSTNGEFNWPLWHFLTYQGKKAVIPEKMIKLAWNPSLVGCPVPKTR